MLNARLAAAETSTEAWRITFGFIREPYSLILKKAGMITNDHARLFNVNYLVRVPGTGLRNIQNHQAE
jgi:hypothetical protein